MSEQWIHQSKNILQTLEKFDSQKKSDRLETINAMMFTLSVLDRSLRGWRGWIGNLAFMSRFTEAELTEIKRGLINCVRPFVQYDLDVTEKHKEKMPQVRFRVRRRQTNQATDGMYV